MINVVYDNSNYYQYSDRILISLSIALHHHTGMKVAKKQKLISKFALATDNQDTLPSGPRITEHLHQPRNTNQVPNSAPPLPRASPPHRPLGTAERPPLRKPMTQDETGKCNETSPKTKPVCCPMQRSAIQRNPVSWLTKGRGRRLY